MCRLLEIPCRVERKGFWGRTGVLSDWKGDYYYLLRSITQLAGHAVPYCHGGRVIIERMGAVMDMEELKK